jgi:hypothetical protein
MKHLALYPLKAGQIYVSGSDETLKSFAQSYKSSPGLINQHTVIAVFEPINDTPLIMVSWAFGGSNVISRDALKIFTIETCEITDAWVTM